MNRIPNQQHAVYQYDLYLVYDFSYFSYDVLHLNLNRSFPFFFKGFGQQRKIHPHPIIIPIIDPATIHNIIPLLFVPLTVFLLPLLLFISFPVPSPSLTVPLDVVLEESEGPTVVVVGVNGFVVVVEVV